MQAQRSDCRVGVEGAVRKGGEVQDEAWELSSRS